MSLEAVCDGLGDQLTGPIVYEQVLAGWVDLEKDVLAVQGDAHVDGTIGDAECPHQANQAGRHLVGQPVRLDPGRAGLYASGQMERSYGYL